MNALSPPTDAALVVRLRDVPAAPAANVLNASELTSPVFVTVESAASIAAATLVAPAAFSTSSATPTPIPAAAVFDTVCRTVATVVTALLAVSAISASTPLPAKIFFAQPMPPARMRPPVTFELASVASKPTMVEPTYALRATPSPPSVRSDPVTADELAVVSSTRTEPPK